MKNIYFFHWPSNLGGADTRLKDLIELFSKSNKYNLFCVPNDDQRLSETSNVNFLKQNNVKILSWKDLPNKTDGYAIAFCNFRLFEEIWRLEKIRNMGLKFIWSNDMMWTKPEESNAIHKNLVSAIIFTSEFHKSKLCSMNPDFDKIKNFILPNYFNFDNYTNVKINKKPYLKDKFVIGKLSRAEWTKYSENFPFLYKNIPIPNAHFRFMGWDEKLKNKYSWFKFDSRFELLPEKAEKTFEFLSQLDIYFFNCHHNYIENQSRSLIEALLLGVPCLVPNIGNFPNMVWHERTGFIYNNIEECYSYMKMIYNDKNLLETLKFNAINITKTIWCNKQKQLKEWEYIFELI